MSLSKGNQGLLDIANLYRGLGYSVIPVHADKTPAVSWKAYQSRYMNSQELENQISSVPVTGIAIITGWISKLAILDFDSIELYQQFSLRFSHLTKTRIVRSRRGYHLYFTIPSELDTSTQKRKDVDWLWRGCYCVAPPSIIDDYEYKVERGGLPMTLSKSDLALIHRFLDEQGKIEAEEIPAEIIKQSLSPDDMVRLYHHHAPHGRNNALFYLGCHAQAQGWSQSSFQQILLDVFVKDCYPDESEHARRIEGIRTIKSAFSRQRRRQGTSAEPRGLPNTVREALMQRQQTYTLRTLEGLRQQGIEAGSYFTEAQAQSHLQGVVGQHSIRQCLASGLLERSDLPPDPRTFVAGLKDKGNISKCLEISHAKPKLIQKGRKTYYYRMPSNIELAALLGVKLTRISDPLSSEDLSSARSTRQASHREFIHRRPGLYASSWLASRMGVSVTTKNRYDQDIPINKKAMYVDQTITWNNLGFINDDEPQAGVFLQDDAGKRYPAKQGIAKYLLKWGRVVTLKKQTFNFYWVGNLLPALPTQAIEKPPIKLWKIPTYPIFEAPIAPKVIYKEPLQVDNKPIEIKIKPEAKPLKKKPSYRRQLTDPYLESCAQKLYQKLLTLGQSDFSLHSARRLVDQYGTKPVDYALWRIQQKENIQNPAGLLTVIARSYHLRA